MGADGTVGLLLQGVANVTPQSLFMIGVSLVLFYLAIVKDYEPLLLLPIGAGCLLANLPLSPLIAEDGMLKILYNAGITNELFPLLIFIGIGALTDFGPLLENPRMVLLGAAGQFGIFATLLAALVFGFSRPEAASIGVIGAIDGPTSIYVSGILAPHLLGPITVAAYSYMSLVPIILPPIMKLLTTKQERCIRMPYSQRQISRRTRIMFPIIVTVLVGTLVPFATPLIGMLMLGNLMKESGVVERLTKASSAEIANGGRRAVRQAAERCQRRQVQSADRCRRDQRVPDGRAGRPARCPGRGLRELPADARDGRECGRSGC